MWLISRLRLGTGGSAEWYTQAGCRGTRANPGAIGCNGNWFRRRRLRVVFADLSQRILRFLSAEIRLAVHYARQCGIRCSGKLSWYVYSTQSYRPVVL